MTRSSKPAVDRYVWLPTKLERMKKKHLVNILRRLLPMFQDSIVVMNNKDFDVLAKSRKPSRKR